MDKIYTYDNERVIQLQDEVRRLREVLDDITKQSIIVGRKKTEFQLALQQQREWLEKQFGHCDNTLRANLRIKKQIAAIDAVLGGGDE